MVPRQPEKRTYLCKVGDYWWLNPAYPEVRQLIADGVAEIVQQYEVDGIHLDDYFTPLQKPPLMPPPLQMQGGQPEPVPALPSQRNDTANLQHCQGKITEAAAEHQSAGHHGRKLYQTICRCPPLGQ
ncbi:MAG: family 10 glycosylhydrolase [Ruminococcus callidus]